MLLVARKLSLLLVVGAKLVVTLGPIEERIAYAQVWLGRGAVLGKPAQSLQRAHRRQHGDRLTRPEPGRISISVQGAGYGFGRLLGDQHGQRQPRQRPRRHDQQILPLDLRLEGPEQCLVEVESGFEIERQPSARGSVELQQLAAQFRSAIQPSLGIEAASQGRYRARQSVGAERKAHPAGILLRDEPCKPGLLDRPGRLQVEILQERLIGVQQGLRVRDRYRGGLREGGIFRELRVQRSIDLFDTGTHIYDARLETVLAGAIASVGGLGHGCDQQLVATLQLLHQVLPLAQEAGQRTVAGGVSRGQLGEGKGCIGVERALGCDEPLVHQLRVRGACAVGRLRQAPKCRRPLSTLGGGEDLAAIGQVHADRGRPARRLDGVLPSLLLDVLQNEGVERGRYGAMIGAVEPLIDSDRFLQAGLGLLRPSCFTQENRMVL